MTRLELREYIKEMVKEICGDKLFHITFKVQDQDFDKVIVRVVNDKLYISYSKGAMNTRCRVPSRKENMIDLVVWIENEFEKAGN